MSNITWVSAFIDLPPSAHQATTDFWAVAIGAEVSSSRGEADQYASLDPGDGEPVLRVQRLDGATSPRIHLDFHVRDVAEARDAAIDAGAELLVESTFAVMGSPGGFTYCFVQGTGDERPGAPIAEPGPHRVDQICIDVPAGAFDAEVEFWATVTGWGAGQTMLPEFRSLTQPDTIPFRLLFQRLGDDDGRRHAHAHLDVSCGEHRSSIRDHHVAAGAVIRADYDHWTIMQDPSGLEYCVTDRRPWMAD